MNRVVVWQRSQIHICFAPLRIPFARPSKQFAYCHTFLCLENYERL